MVANCNKSCIMLDALCIVHALCMRNALCIVFLLCLLEPARAQRHDSLAAIQNSQRADSMLVGQLRRHGVSFSSDNSIALLMTGQEKFDDMFAAIRQAKSSIHLEYFNFRNDSIARRLFVLLGQKAKEGVEVRALFDAFGNMSNNRPLKRAHLDSIRAEGIEIFKFDPITFPWVNHVFSRDHRKIVVIDGQIAYTGGMNVADYYIKGTAQVGSWNDMHCRIDGTEVNTLQAIFLRIWNKVSGQNVHGAKYYRGWRPADYFHGLKPDTTATRYKKMVGVVNREPRVSNEIIREFYTDAINDARDSIKIINPYFTLNRTLMHALKRAVRRGVKVDIMLSTRSDIPLTPDCGFYNAHKLMKAGCNIYMYTPGFHHTKIIMVDGQFCTVGSANLNARSLNFDYEENLVIVDPCTTRELDLLFEREKKDCWLMTEERWDEWRTPWQKFRGWLGKRLAPFL